MEQRKAMVALLARREHEGLRLRFLPDEVGIPIGTLAGWSWRLRRRSGDFGADLVGPGAANQCPVVLPPTAEPSAFSSWSWLPSSIGAARRCSTGDGLTAAS